ncbi:MAG: ABC transporter six-transmembrane domain-containing protein [Bacteroidota bacterium]|nr:ABC transporter six-transmembrane domain-containing protein [Bacteroidota bacterium]
MTLRQVIKEYKLPISLVLSFVIIENVAWIIEPGYFGKLLDALIYYFYDHEKKADYITPLIIWILIYLLNVLGGTFSRYFSGKVYSQMYAKIATRVVITSQKIGLSDSRTLARAELAKEYIVFLRERLPEVTWQFCATFGAIIALFIYDWRIAAVCLVVIIPISLINRFYRKYVGQYQKSLHDTQEDLYRVIEEKRMSKITEYFFSMARPQSHIARWNSLNYGIIKLILMVIFIVVLFICVDVDNFTTGKIYSVVAYLWTYISSTEYIPGLMESITSVMELSHRLKEEEV